MPIPFGSLNLLIPRGPSLNPFSVHSPAKVVTSIFTKSIFLIQWFLESVTNRKTNSSLSTLSLVFFFISNSFTK